MVGVGTPQSCGLRKTALEFVRQDEPTDAGGLGTRECVLFARVMELVDVPDSKSGGFGRAGSSPALGTIKVGVLTLCLATNEDAHRTRFFSTEVRKLKREASRDWLQTVFGITIKSP